MAHTSAGHHAKVFCIGATHRAHSRGQARDYPAAREVLLQLCATMSWQLLFILTELVHLRRVQQALPDLVCGLARKEGCKGFVRLGPLDGLAGLQEGKDVEQIRVLECRQRAALEGGINHHHLDTLVFSLSISERGHLGLLGRAGKERRSCGHCDGEGTIQGGRPCKSVEGYCCLGLRLCLVSRSSIFCLVGTDVAAIHPANICCRSSLSSPSRRCYGDATAMLRSGRHNDNLWGLS